MLFNAHSLPRLEWTMSFYINIWVFLDLIQTGFNLGMGWTFLILGVVVVFVCECV